MDITPAISPDAQVIQSYGPGGFRISNVIYRQPVIVTPERTMEWGVTSPEALTEEDFTPLLALYSGGDPEIEVVLLGCGKHGFLVPSKLRLAMKSYGISIDAMDTGAACRTYNVMLPEERRVAAALFPS